ncbi:antitoxin [Streptacidiphilus sp. MAP5-3]|uniref:antitoxin n=1 Tax=unclassified Streptacidiphilus TaxID=2643834 RepID=UPI003512CE36
MGLTDSLKGALDQASKKATEYAGSHKSQIGAGLDKVGDMADKATKGKYHSQIHQGRDKAKDAVNKFGGAKDTIPGEATEKPAEPGQTGRPGDTGSAGQTSETGETGGTNP